MRPSTAIMAAGFAAGMAVGVRSDQVMCPVVPAGAETAGAGDSILNAGQSAIGRSSGGGIHLHAGVIPCYVLHTPVTITAWRTVRSHSGLGGLGITLDAAASGNDVSGPTVEPRVGGIQRIELDFSGPVGLLSPAGVSVIGRTTVAGVMGAPVPYAPTSVTMADADTLAILFDPGVLPDETCYSITIGAGTISSMIAADAGCSIRALVADTTMSGVVNLSDVLWTASKVGQAAAANPAHDVTLSGGSIVTDHALFVKDQVASPPRQALCP